MPKAIFTAKHFQDPEAARVLIEATRWPGGPVCGHCSEEARKYATKKPGRWRCGNPACRKDYTVTTGMVMESSHIKLNVWLQAMHLAASSKKGFSAHQLHRTLGITYKSAWFLHHRIMEAMREGKLDMGQLGGAGMIVEADETYFGGIESKKMRTAATSGAKFTKAGKSGPSNKRAIVTLVERGGRARSFHVPSANKRNVAGIVADNIAQESRLHTDESNLYTQIGGIFENHETVKHSAKEYARGDVHVNSAEGYFSIFKRGMRGVYQHCSEKHLHRYLAEFDFRYNRRTALGWNDEQRSIALIEGAVGKRLTYKKPH